jgi:ATP-dependent DNA helicase PIF1
MLPSYSTFVTASTGIAAINIGNITSIPSSHSGGITLHSFSGIGLGDASVAELVERISNGFHLTWWQRCKVLVIDEISMIDAELFDKLDVIGRILRKNKNPFGGIQLVICGDFFQLPPVGRADEDGKPKQFCFQAESWKKSIQVVVELKQVFRQADEVFVNILNEIRHGCCARSSLEILQGCKDHELEAL